MLQYCLLDIPFQSETGQNICPRGNAKPAMSSKWDGREAANYGLCGSCLLLLLSKRVMLFNLFSLRKASSFFTSGHVANSMIMGSISAESW